MDWGDPSDVLARTVWAEARNQGRAGMEAVAAVILNRAKHPRWWGHDIVSVCMDAWQFTCWNYNDPNREKCEAVSGHDPTFVTALLVADHAIAGRLADPTNGADSYYAAGTPEPRWTVGREPCAVIGAHRFYRVELPPPS